MSIAVSFASEDKHLALLLHILLEQQGIQSFTYTTSLDQIHDLEMDLEQKYQQSYLNLIIVSSNYIKKLKDKTSYIYRENRIIRNRFQKNSRTVFLVREDEIFHPEYPNINTFGITRDFLNIIEIIRTRYIENFQFNSMINFTNVEHPFCAQYRGKMLPCKFKIIQDCVESKHPVIGNRWSKYGDIAVKIIDHQVPRDHIVFLIPSGCIPIHLVHTNFLMHNPQALSIKKAISRSFIEKYKNQEIKGWLFDEITRDGKKYKLIYSIHYDKVLYNSLQSSWKKR